MASVLTNKLYHLGLLMRLDKPIGIFLLLWPTVWALWLAGNGHPDARLVVIFILGVVIMRSAGCVVNDIADRHFDGQVARTRQRPLASGAVSLNEALGLLVGLGCLALYLATLLNPLALRLSLAGAALATFYPFTKRFLEMPQLVLGLAFAWAVPMAFAAQTGVVPAGGWFLFAIAAIWPVIYDTFYAMVDREDDRRLPIKSSALWLGQHDRWVTGLLQVIMFAMLWGLPYFFELGVTYRLGLLGAMVLAVYQQWLIRNREPDACFRAFLNNHWLGLVVAAGVVSTYF